MKKIVTVVQNTHWDYEWYFTNDQSTVLFEFFMKELLFAFREEKIDHFVLDGQMGILEKYLKNNPNDTKEVKNLVRKNKLKIGPWFTQTDQMIISAESITRNLLLGHNLSKELGGTWKMAYCPDVFGQAQNMPKIYNEFGINKMVFWRGLSKRKSLVKEILWSADDGSKVKALNIPEGYYSGGSIFWGTNPKTNRPFLDEIMIGVNENSTIRDFNIISCGGDQRYVDLNIKETIKDLNNKQKMYEYKLGTYEEYFKKFKTSQLTNVKGELLDSQDSKIHRSIYSHRYDHKYMNDYAERLITQTLEPLVAMATKAGITQHLKLIENAWRLMLLNSAHDSAGGCNSDETNEHITNRFNKAIEITESYIDIIIRKISETAYKENELILFNTTALNKDLWKDVNVISKKESFKIIDGSREIEFDIVNKEKVYYGSIKKTKEEHDPNLYYYRYTITFKKKLKPLSFKSIKIKESNGTLEAVEKKSNVIENKNYKIFFERGKFFFKNKINNKTIENWIEIISEADDGDTYDFSPLENSKAQILNIKSPKIKISKGKIQTSLKIAGILEIFENLNSWKTKEAKIVKQPFTLTITIGEDKLISIFIKTKNKAKDHRLRIKFNTDIKFENSIADTHFGFVKRPIIQEELENWRELKWNEEPTGIYPVLSNVILEDDSSALNILLNGIKEYEAKTDQSLELTLYRSIGWLGKPNLIRRPGKASGQEYKYVPTPDSQLLEKEMSWKIGIIPFNITRSQLRREQMLFSTTNTYYQNQELDLFTGPLKYFSSNKWQGVVEKNSSLFEKIDVADNIEISIVKQLDENKQLIRIFNLTDKQIEKPLTIKDKNISKAYVSNLLEEEVEEIRLNNDSFSLESIGPHKISSIIISRRKHGY